MIISCWSAKGGQGTTVIACALALVMARAHPTTGALLVDLAGDALTVLGKLDDPVQPGVAEWTREGDAVPSDGLARLEVSVDARMSLLPRGSGPFVVNRAHALVGLLASDPRPVVVDAGVVSAGDTAGFSATAAAASHESLLVTRSCFLALRRALNAPIRPTGIVLVLEEGRSLTARDVEDALGAPVRARIPATAQIARTIDSGTLVHRLPRELERELRHAA